MSSIEKLGITGLRSYDPERIESIDFFRPLTLILGKNGSGKTTILEALRFAICGAMPPETAKGRGFVWDPRLAGRNETKAAVKLKFTAVGNRAVLCVRSMLLQTGRNEGLRKMEQFLRLRSTEGEVLTIGHTCAEIDRQMPELLGLSRAVIESVVLCHQEEAMWPFSDSAGLKKVFDELFDTARVAKLAEQLSAVLRDKKRLLREEKIALDYSRREVERFAELQLELKNALESHGRATGQLDRLRLQLSTDADFSELENAERSLGATDEQIKRLRFDLEMLEKDLQRWALTRSPEDLRLALDPPPLNPSPPLRPAGSFLARLAQILWGRLPSDDPPPRHVPRTETPDQHRNICSLEFPARGEALPFSESPPPEVIDSPSLDWQAFADLPLPPWAAYRTFFLEKTAELSRRISEQTHLVTQLNDSLRQSDLVYLLKDIRTLYMKHMSRTLEREWTGEGPALASLDDEIARTRTQINEAETRSSTLESQTRENESSLTLNLDRLGHQIRKRAELDSLEQFRLLDLELKNSSLKLQDLAVKQKLLAESTAEAKQRKVLLERETALTTTHVLHRRFAELEKRRQTLVLKVSFRGSGRESIELALEERRALLSEEQKARERTDRAEVEVEALKKAKEKEKRALEEANTLALAKLDLSQLGGMVASDPEYLFSEYKSGKEKLQKAEAQVNLMKYVTNELLPYMIQVSVKSGRCVVCDKSVHPNETPNVEANLTRKLSAASSKIGLVSCDVESLRSKHSLLKKQRKELREVEQRAEKRREIVEELDSLCAALSDFALERKITIEKIESVEREIETLKELQSVEISLAEFDRQSLDPNFIWDAERDDKMLETLRRELKSAEETLYRSERSTLEFQAETAAEEARCEKLRRELGGFSLNDEFSGEEQSLASLSELQTKQRELKRNLEASQENFKATRASLETEKRQLTLRLQSLEELRDKVGQYATALRQNSLNDKKEAAEKEILAINSELQVFEARQQLVAMLERREAAEIELLRLEKARRLLETSRSDLLKRRSVFETLRGSIAKLEGEIGAFRGRANEIMDRLSKEQNCERTFIEKQAGFEFQRLCIEDLEALHRSVEGALVDFHRQKIEEINRIIDSIWKATYAGEDIVSVQIRSEELTNESERSRKNYEYKVVFLNKNRKELPMRGHCSSGQKVLASIVIRLALSEAFCLNCGLLALDEPTTNLDEDNVRLLGNFLKRLIKTRENQKSFQLVVITHDPQFIEVLSSYLSTYYLVSKDQKGFSKITPVEVSPH